MFFGKKNKAAQTAPQCQFQAAAATEKPFDMNAFRGMWDSTASASYSAFSNSPSNSNSTPKHTQNVL